MTPRRDPWARLSEEADTILANWTNGNRKDALRLLTKGHRFDVAIRAMLLPVDLDDKERMAMARLLLTLRDDNK